MAGEWSTRETGFELPLGEGIGWVSVHVDPAAGPLVVAVEATPRGNVVVQLEPISVEFRDPSGRRHSLRPAALPAFPELGTLVVPMTVPTATGLTMTARLLPQGAGLNLDFEAQTVAEVADLSVQVRITSWGGQGLPRRDRLLAGTEPSQTHACVGEFPLGAGTALCLFVDPGELGQVREGPATSGIRTTDYLLFRQSLEKGVILVGRFGLVALPEPIDPDRLAELYGRWLERLTCL